MSVFGYTDKYGLEEEERIFQECFPSLFEPNGGYPILEGGEVSGIYPFKFNPTTNVLSDGYVWVDVLFASELMPGKDVIRDYRDLDEESLELVRSSMTFCSNIRMNKGGYAGRLLYEVLAGFGPENEMKVFKLMMDGSKRFGEYKIECKTQCSPHTFVNVTTEIAYHVETPHVVTEVPEVEESVPKLPWGSVDYKDPLVASIYSKDEYNTHLTEALKVLIRCPGEKKIVAPCDGAGVVYKAATELGREVVSTDISKAMIEEGRLKGNDVQFGSIFSTIEENEGLIFLMYIEGISDDIVERIIQKFPDRRYIVLSDIDSFAGRSHFVHYDGRSKLYTKGIQIRKGVKLPQRNITSNYYNIIDHDEIYYISDVESYMWFRHLHKLGITPTVSVKEFRFAEGLMHVVAPSKKHVYCFTKKIDIGYTSYLNLVTGKQGPIVEVRNVFKATGVGLARTRGHIKGALCVYNVDYRVYKMSRGVYLETYRDFCREVVGGRHSKGCLITKGLSSSRPGSSKRHGKTQIRGGKRRRRIKKQELKDTG